MIRWGVIGAGGFASVKPIPALKRAENCQLEAVMDVVGAKELAEKHQTAKYYEKLKDLLEDKTIDAVYIATPVFLHKQHTIKAAEKSKHVLCEKPMALSIDDCQQMIEACKENNVKLGIGYMRRFHPYHQQIKEIIDGGQLGTIVLARIQTHLWYPGGEDAWRKNPKLGGGGSFMDMGSHCLELLQFFFGEVLSVNAVMSSAVFGSAVEDTAAVTLRFGNGVVGLIDSSFAVPQRENVVEVYGTKGTLLAARTAGPFTNPVMRLLDENGKREIKPSYNANQYQVQFERFAQCIAENKSSAVDGQAGLENLRLILSIYESAEKRTEILVS